MPTVKVVAELTVDDLIDAVSQLTSDELAEFQLRFDELWPAQLPSVDAEAAQVAVAHRLPAQDQVRLRTLLMKNREGDLTVAEERELDAYMADLDQRLDQVADDLLELAEHRQQRDDS